MAPPPDSTLPLLVSLIKGKKKNGEFHPTNLSPAFGYTLLTFQIILILVWGLFGTYNTDNENDVATYYSFWVNVHIMMLLGFGGLMQVNIYTQKRCILCTFLCLLDFLLNLSNITSQFPISFHFISILFFSFHPVPSSLWVWCNRVYLFSHTHVLAMGYCCCKFCR